MKPTLLWTLIVLAQLLTLALFAANLPTLVAHVESFGPGDFACFRDNAGKLLGHLARVNTRDTCAFMVTVASATP